MFTCSHYFYKLLIHWTFNCSRWFYKLIIQWMVNCSQYLYNLIIHCIVSIFSYLNYSLFVHNILKWLSYVQFADIVIVAYFLISSSYIYMDYTCCTVYLHHRILEQSLQLLHEVFALETTRAKITTVVRNICIRNYYRAMIQYKCRILLGAWKLPITFYISIYKISYQMTRY